VHGGQTTAYEVRLVSTVTAARMSDGKYNVYAEKCPTRQALDRIADKSTALIVGLLGQRTHRFGELRRGIEGISHKVLSQNLRSLERDGLVLRKPLPSLPPSDR